MTVREAGQSFKSATLTSHIAWQVLVLALSYLHLYMIWIIEHGCVEVKACGQNTIMDEALFYKLMQIKWANAVTL